MSELVGTIWGVAILTVLFGGLPYGIWVIYSVYKKRWRLVFLQVVIPVIAILALFPVTSVVDKIAYTRYLKGLYDADVKLEPALYVYGSPRAFNGDGYSIAVYPLPETIRRRFESADERLLSEFPKRPDYRGHWDSQHWREAPFDPKFEEYLDFALSRNDSQKEPRLVLQFEAIRKALSRKGTYYAFFSYAHGDYPGNIDLFIVDLHEGRIYSINHNT